MRRFDRDAPSTPARGRARHSLRCARPHALVPALLAVVFLPATAGPGAPAPVAAQESGPHPGAPQDEADARVLERARDAQRDFERFRRRELPRAPWISSRCDEHIGRFCLTHDDDEGWSPAPASPGVRRARAALLASLDSAARSLPADRWILGQRVKYRTEAGRLGEALALARGCPGRDAWCAALEGFVLHAEGRDRQAAGAFERALLRLPPAERCAWEDISHLLEGDDRERYGDLQCGAPERAAFERTFWGLSEPLWGQPGHPRRTEHLVRRVWAALQSDAASPYGVGWGRDLEELTIRYGWPDGWDVAWRRDPGIRTERSIRAHRLPEARRYAVIGMTGDAARWDLGDDEPRSTWAPPFGPVRDGLEAQVAAFRRGDRRLVVAALRPPPDLRCPGRAGLYLGGEEARIIARREAPVDGRGATGPTVLESLEPASWAASWIGVEWRCGGDEGAARWRRPLPRGAIALSDLLILDPSEEPPGTLDAALDRVRTSLRVSPGEPIDVFWEWYGPDAAAVVSLTLAREEKGFWRKALEWTGLAERSAERTGVRWLDPGRHEGPGRALRLQLPDLAPGRYRLTLQVQSARVGTVLSTREVVVEG